MIAGTLHVCRELLREIASSRPSVPEEHLVLGRTAATSENPALPRKTSGECARLGVDFDDMP